jgi:quinol monooxygenase YgiN
MGQWPEAGGIANKGKTMATHLIATIKGGTLDQYDQASAQIIKPGLPDGLLHHVCVPTEDGFMVIETWDSEQAAQAFTGSERFQKATGATGMPQPDIQIRPVHYVQTATK